MALSKRRKGVFVVQVISTSYVTPDLPRELQEGLKTLLRQYEQEAFDVTLKMKPYSWIAIHRRIISSCALMLEKYLWSPSVLDSELHRLTSKLLGEMIIFHSLFDIILAYQISFQQQIPQENMSLLIYSIELFQLFAI